MATVRDGSRPALVVADLKPGALHRAPDAPRVVGQGARTVERARAGGVPVIWVQHTTEAVDLAAA
jgi:nicotinamidase-related amidase